ncbi:hypothetical protein P3T86_05635 [Staphylococcus nepalensis]|uniref:hypothetical protein n=1 Tax=Staphylococcus nepalensis TaxID=214473 RepID=UPI002B2591AD|nr:hypothetical protein [Staphylococcus nepalensis]WQL19493.1 hypothetical protein P3T86_09865 [Staphylococcus nepalensis]WQL21241.1 hypothetical protein P3T86_05635 [Staphylococcus nepalensis]
MVKIKQKKTMNVSQLIEWAWNNDITNKEYICNEFKKKSVIFNLSGWAEFSDEFSYNPHDTFTVEVEEEITEDTKLDLVERFIGGMGSVCYTSHTMSIKECLKRSPRDCTTTHFYIENDDRELILIWRNGKLAE